jgi:hypothetical protein
VGKKVHSLVFCSLIVLLSACQQPAGGDVQMTLDSSARTFRFAGFDSETKGFRDMTVKLSEERVASLREFLTGPCGGNAKAPKVGETWKVPASVANKYTVWYDSTNQVFSLTLWCWETEQHWPWEQKENLIRANMWFSTQGSTELLEDKHQ